MGNEDVNGMKDFYEQVRKTAEDDVPMLKMKINFEKKIARRNAILQRKLWKSHKAKKHKEFLKKLKEKGIPLSRWETNRWS